MNIDGNVTRKRLQGQCSGAISRSEELDILAIQGQSQDTNFMHGTMD